MYLSEYLNGEKKKKKLFSKKFPSLLLYACNTISKTLRVASYK